MGSITWGREMAAVYDQAYRAKFEPSVLGPIVDLLGGLARGGPALEFAVGTGLAGLAGFDRPRRLGSRTASSVMETSGALTFAADGGGTVMSWDWQARPKGWLRLLGPLSGPLGGRMERRIWTRLKHQLEGHGRARPA